MPQNDFNRHGRDLDRRLLWHLDTGLDQLITWIGQAASTLLQLLWSIGILTVRCAAALITAARRKP